MLKLTAILGSNRPQSNTARTMALVIDELVRAGGVTVDRIDPRELDLRVPGTPGSDGVVAKVSADLQQRVKASDGVAIVTPEYDASYSAVLKLVMEHLGYPSVLDGKPVALVGIASGRIGALRALEHLRSMCVSIGALVVPGSQSIAGIHKAFDATTGKCTDQTVEAAVRSAARELVRHARAFKAAP